MSFGAMMMMAMEDVPLVSNPAFTGDPYIVFDFQVGMAAKAGIEIDADGGIESFDSLGNNGDIGRWDGGGSFVIGDYDFRLDRTSGSLDGSFAHSVWYPGSGPLINYFAETNAVQSFVGTLRMRPTGGGADLDTAAVNLSAEGGV